MFVKTHNVYMEDKLQAGDIIVYHGNSLLSKSIQKFMKIYRKKLGLPYKNIKIYNHTATIIDVWHKLYVVEALGKGITIRPFSVAYGNKLKDCEFRTPTIPYTDFEKKFISKRGMELTFSPTRYDVFNFFYQIYKVLTTKPNAPGKWLGPKRTDAKGRLYCSETSGYLANLTRSGTCPKWWESNPVDIQLLTTYKIVE